MAGVQQLMQLTGLTSLKLANSRGLTNAGLKGVRQLRALRHLQLTYSLAQPAWLELFTAGGHQPLSRYQALGMESKQILVCMSSLCFVACWVPLRSLQQRLHTLLLHCLTAVLPSQS